LRFFCSVDLKAFLRLKSLLLELLNNEVRISTNDKVTYETLYEKAKIFHLLVLSFSFFFFLGYIWIGYGYLRLGTNPPWYPSPNAFDFFNSLGTFGFIFIALGEILTWWAWIPLSETPFKEKFPGYFSSKALTPLKYEEVSINIKSTESRKGPSPEVSTTKSTEIARVPSPDLDNSTVEYLA